MSEYFEIFSPSGIKGPGQIVCPLTRNDMFTNFLSLTKLKVKIKLYSVLIMTAKTHSSVFF